MIIQKQIKDNIKIAMLNKDTQTRDILRVVVGEFNRLGKDISDENAISIIKKMYNNAKDINNTIEMELLKQYLPIQMNEEQLNVIIKLIITENSIDSIKGMGRVMGELKKKYSGEYDGAIASKLVKENLIK